MKLQKWTQNLGRRTLTALLFVILVGLVVWAHYFTLTTQSGGMTDKDFMSLWTGGKAIALGLNPYDVEVWRPLRAAYGSHWMPDPISPWPLWTHLFFVPFSFLSTQAAGALWMTICEFSLVWGIALIVQTSGWKNPTYFFALTLGAFMFRSTFPAIITGQVSPVLFLLLAAAYALYDRGHFFAAGLLLSIEVIKPNLTALLLFTMGLMFLARRNWRALTGMATGGLILLVASWIVLPGWPLQWLSIVETGKGHVAHLTPTLWGLAYELGGARLWPQAALVAGGLFYLGLLVLIWKQRGEDWLFSFSLAIIASVFLAPYLWAYEQVILFFPTTAALLHWGLFSRRRERWGWWAGWWFVSVVLSWPLYFVARERRVDTWSALIPLASLGYLVLAWRAHRVRASSEAYR